MTSDWPEPKVRVIRLSDFVGKGDAWGRPVWIVAIWTLAEWAFVSNPLQISSRVRVAVLRLFGARIGSNVIFRPRTRVKSPWNLSVGNDCWIGEGVWFHNQDLIDIGHDVVISQETFLTTGSHAYRRDMSLVTKPILIESGVWITSRCIITGGVSIGRSALVRPMTLVSTDVEANMIVGTQNPAVFGRRFT